MYKAKRTQQIPILYLNYSMEVGGIEIMIYELVCKLNENGFSPSICVFKGGGSLEKKLGQKGIPIYCIDKREGIDLSVIPRLRKLLQRENIKILHTHNFSGWLYGGLASMAIKSLKHIHTEHSNVDKKRRAWAEKLLSYFTDAIICVSERGRQFMIANQGISPERLTIIYNGVDTEKFYPDPEKKKAYREKLGIRNGVPTIGIVARLTPVKDHFTLLRAFSKLSKNISDAILLVVGDGELRNELENETGKLDLKDRVLFLGEQSDIAELLNVIDVFTLSSLSEGHNIALLEAMATSLPVVVTDVGGNQEIVLDGVTGHLVPSKSYQALADKIISVISDKGLMFKMGRKAREVVLSKFSVEKMAENYRKQYIDLLERNI